MTNGASSGYVMQSDGSGNASWVDPTTINTAGDLDWTISGNNIYNANTANVGIGNTNPQQKLDVTGNVLADKITKDGFLTSKAGYLKDQNINNPENKIILIYNHGQKSHDGPSSDCAWKSGMQNISSLVGKKINECWFSYFQKIL